MHPINTVNQWFDVLHQTGKIPRLQLDDDGLCTAVFNNDLELSICTSNTSPYVVFHAQIQAVKPPLDNGLLAQVLADNHENHDLAGAYFSLSQNHDFLYLCFKDLVERLDHQTFYNILSNFIGVATATRERLAGENNVAETETAENVPAQHWHLTV